MKTFIILGILFVIGSFAAMVMNSTLGSIAFFLAAFSCFGIASHIYEKKQYDYYDRFKTNLPYLK